MNNEGFRGKLPGLTLIQVSPAIATAGFLELFSLSALFDGQFFY
jgi:hypothetical protein